jgi:pimeloyl-ACP methyl ester carboxylesterase
MPLKPFRIDIPQGRLDLLDARLRDTVWADVPDGSCWAYGVAGDYLRELAEYWIEQYDWREHETAMNRWTHLRGELDGSTLHLLHERGSGSAPVPLILTHGWPWTFWDFAKVIEPQTASLWVRLMSELGYQRFGAHGGDSGAFVSAQLAHAHADRLIGAHLSYPALLDPSAVFGRDDFDADEVEDFERQRDPMSNMTHFLVHMLEPQTLAWALQDSPIGLASWMLHRRAAWSDCDGDVERRFTKDELITSFALYWLTGTVSSSLRFYADSFRQPWQPSHDLQPTLQAPTGIAVFPRELSHVPRSVAERYANLTHWTRMPSGGHFAPMEEPELLVQDIRAFFRPLRSS